MIPSSPPGSSSEVASSGTSMGGSSSHLGLFTGDDRGAGGSGSQLFSCSSCTIWEASALIIGVSGSPPLMEAHSTLLSPLAGWPKSRGPSSSVASWLEDKMLANVLLVVALPSDSSPGVTYLSIGSSMSSFSSQEPSLSDSWSAI